MPYTLDDMAAAQAELDDAQRRFDDYGGNNPNKHRAALSPARLRLDLIVSDLRQRGISRRRPEATQEALFRGAGQPARSDGARCRADAAAGEWRSRARPRCER
jgi:hypothetical protein